MINSISVDFRNQKNISMKRIHLIILSIILFVQAAFSQYQPKSGYILQPEKYIDYVKSNMEFWKSHAFDATYGGFYSSISQNGSILNTNQKSLIVQTRHGYGFTRAFMLTGDTTYLNYAKSALNFLYSYGWDKTYGGWYCFAQRNGALDNRSGWNPNAKKWGFQQHYALLGIIANFEATQDSVAKTWIDKGMNSLNTHMWDSRTNYKGYYSDGTLNWGTMTGKGFTPTVDAITTNAELNYLVTKDAAYKSRLLELADIITQRFVPLMDNVNVKVLYPETYNADWVTDFSNTEVSIGHFIKTAWCLGRAYLCDTTHTEYKEAADKILQQVLNWSNGSYTLWDNVNGGPYTDMYINTGTPGGTDGTYKDYWTLEQGFTGPMINYYITGNDEYLRLADEATDFFMNYQVDKTYGEIFSQVSSNGLTVMNSVKGDDFKASYHSTEMGYYGYLYSKLYYLNQPATLYYKFDKKKTARSIALQPIPMPESNLKIQSVELNGVSFNQFNADTRTLNIAANEGGVFKVTFLPIGRSVSGILKHIKSNASIYPTLVADNITITSENQIQNIRLVELSGRTVREFTSTSTEAIINVSDLCQGVYIVFVTDVDGLVSHKKIIKK